MADSFDVIVVGAGPAGYVAAIRCAQLGLRTACIDERAGARGKPSLGGACLNVGCIPSKALLDSSEQYEHITRHAKAHGITAGKTSMDVGKMQARKDAIVQKLTGGIEMLFKANRVEQVHGRAKLLAKREVEIHAPGEKNPRRMNAKHIILAPGAAPVELPGIPFDGKKITDSTGALSFDKTPARLGVIGAGVIGLELGSVWSRLGAKITLLEALDEFLAAADPQIAREAARQFAQQGLDIRLGAAVQKVENAGRGVRMHYEQKGKKQMLEVDRVVVAVGRRPATADLLAPDCGVTADKAGFIEVDENCRTHAENIWAVGDAVRGPMLAHKGSEEGMAVAERIAGGAAHVDFNTVPWVIYTAPEIAWVGRTEKQLREQNIPVRAGAFPFAATGRALAMDAPAGMVKILAHEKTDRILGVHMLGAHVSELIGECVLAMEFQASSEDLARTIHAHPTLSEAVHEAALAVDGRAIHKAK
ncbi:MAG: dihydrolipoyl dehydrogenase [Gammaproteobacteria bacterium]|nr:dihydrolipoyl dehydrogenase [Gammaproteobacteria bacterium]